MKKEITPMKTSVTMNSTDRDLFGTRIRQETGTEMLCLTDLMEAYTQARVKNKWPEKNITEILTTSHNDETIYYLLYEQGKVKLDISSFTLNIKEKGFVKYMKELGVYKTSRKGGEAVVWVNPYIFVMVAMELNPIFKAKVITWLTDTLIINRIDAGTLCKELNAAAENTFGKLDVGRYSRLAMSLNRKIFGFHETGIRNRGTQKELASLRDLEKQMTYLLKKRYITDFDLLISEIETYEVGC